MIQRGMPPQRLATLKVLQGGKKLTTVQVENAIDKEHHHNIAKQLSNYRMQGWIDNEYPGARYGINRQAVWFLTPKAEEFLKTGVMPPAGKTKAKKRKYTKRQPEAQPIPSPPPRPNISSTADTLAENITSLIAENATYRELLLELHTTIEKRLQIGKFANEITTEN